MMMYRTILFKLTQSSLNIRTRTDDFKGIICGITKNPITVIIPINNGSPNEISLGVWVRLPACQFHGITL